MRRNAATPGGFTIIEVLIVLAIVGLIMVIVFLVVPTAQQQTRNHGRKAITEQVAAAMDEYKSSYNRYPETDTEAQYFFDTFLKNIPDTYTMKWESGGGADHSYIPEFDTVKIAAEHWCNKYGDGNNATDPIAGTIPAHRKNRFVVYTILEPEDSSNPRFFCIDNYTK